MAQDELPQARFAGVPINARTAALLSHCQLFRTYKFLGLFVGFFGPPSVDLLLTVLMITLLFEMPTGIL